MIDFHTHILPGIDDGSRSVEESIQLLQEESRQGVDTVFLTPHFYAERRSPVEFLKKRYSAWKSLSTYITPDLPNIRLGAEVQYFEGISTVEDIRHLRIAGTDLLLLEMPFCRWTERMVETVSELTDLWDVRVVLAHIERYLPMQSPELWAKLRSRGIFMQSNVSFFQNWQTRRQAMRMLSEGGIQFVGSDCHNLDTRRPNWEKFPSGARHKLMAVPQYQELSQLNTDGIHNEFL